MTTTEKMTPAETRRIFDRIALHIPGVLGVDFEEVPPSAYFTVRVSGRRWHEVIQEFETELTPLYGLADFDYTVVEDGTNDGP